MKDRCKLCGSYAINHHIHGRDGSDPDLCDVCYWRSRADASCHVLLDLLATIHRDDGQYTAQYGIEKSIADAITIIYDNRTDKQQTYAECAKISLGMSHRDDDMGAIIASAIMQRAQQ